MVFLRRVAVYLDRECPLPTELLVGEEGVLPAVLVAVCPEGRECQECLEFLVARGVHPWDLAKLEACAPPPALQGEFRGFPKARAELAAARGWVREWECLLEFSLPVLVDPRQWDRWELDFQQVHQGARGIWWGRRDLPEPAEEWHLRAWVAEWRHCLEPWGPAAWVRLRE